VYYSGTVKGKIVKSEFDLCIVIKKYLIKIKKYIWPRQTDVGA